MGEMKIPSDAYYGAQTARAVENFQISGQTAHKRFIWAGLQIKKTAALVNGSLDTIGKKQANAILNTMANLRWKSSMSSRREGKPCGKPARAWPISCPA